MTTKTPSLEECRDVIVVAFDNMIKKFDRAGKLAYGVFIDNQKDCLVIFMKLKEKHEGVIYNEFLRLVDRDQPTWRNSIGVSICTMMINTLGADEMKGCL